MWMFYCDIININYKMKNRNLTYCYYLTLGLGDTKSEGIPM